MMLIQCDQLEADLGTDCVGLIQRPLSQRLLTTAPTGEQESPRILLPGLPAFCLRHPTETYDKPPENNSYTVLLRPSMILTLGSVFGIHSIQYIF